MTSGNATPEATDIAKLRALLARVKACAGDDDGLSHDIWWELVDVPTGATREVNGRREINILADRPELKPQWRAPGSDYFGDSAEKPLLINSLDRAADLAGRVLAGWKWQLYSGGGPDDDLCFACVYRRTGAFTAVSRTEPAALIAAILEAKIAEMASDRARTPFHAEATRTLPHQEPPPPGAETIGRPATERVARGRRSL